MTGEKRQQMLADPDRADTRSASTVGNAEGLVQVEMTDIRSESPRSAETNLSIEVRSIQIHLPTMVMNKTADLSDAGLEYSVG
jgi:hypothetical protein